MAPAWCWLVKSALREWDSVRRTVSHAVLLGLFLIVTLLLLGILAIDQVLLLQDAPVEIWGMVKDYLGIWMWSMFPMVLAMIANGAMRAYGDTMASSLILIIMALFNAILDPILIHGWGPVPALGLEGAAWATLGANVVAALMLSLIHI